MQTQITVRHFEAQDALKEYAEKKVSKLERFYDGITEARIVLTEDGSTAGSRTAEIVVYVYQQTLSSTCNAASHEDAIDQCVRALLRQLEKYKAKLRSTDKDYHK